MSFKASLDSCEFFLVDEIDNEDFSVVSKIKKKCATWATLKMYEILPIDVVWFFLSFFKMQLTS